MKNAIVDPDTKAFTVDSELPIRYSPGPSQVFCDDLIHRTNIMGGDKVCIGNAISNSV